MGPEISIVIPVYNVEKYIRQCIDSVIKQSELDMEIIAVDDGSPDGCPAILDDYASKDTRIRVIHQKNSGVSEARNRGIEAANGKWVYFVDSDDWLIEGQLKSAVEKANDLDADILFLNCVEQYESGMAKRVKLFSSDFVYTDHEHIMQVQKSILCHKYSPYFSSGADNAYPAPWSKLIRTSLVKKNAIRFDPYVGGVYDDGLFTLEILEVAKKIGYAGNCVYNYRILNSSIVHAFRAGMVEKFEKNCQRVSEFAERNNKGNTFMQAEYARRIAYLSSFMSAYFFSPDNKNSRKEKYAELRRALSRSPWKEAVDNASLSDLESKHKLTLACMKTRCLIGLKMYSDLKKKIKN